MRFSYKYKYKKGITAMEVMIVVAIMAILVAVVLPTFNQIKESQVLKNGTEEVSSAIHKAQTNTLASLNSSEYGVHLQSDKVIIFKGQVFSSGAVDNETINIVSPATISNVTLLGVSGTSGDIYFARLSGAPNKTGTITVSTSSLTKVITVSATGAVSIN